jgi:hypothetical protein
MAAIEGHELLPEVSEAMVDHGKDSHEILTHRHRVADRGPQPEPGVH